MAEAIHDAERLKELQALPLDRKIQISQARIIEWYQRNKGNVVVSFSGGKDSTVLLHLVRSIYPDVPAVFSNTGLEYPEIQRFVRTFPNVTIVAPKMNFSEVISTYGYPLIGKEVAEAIYYARRIRSQSVQVERERENKGRITLLKRAELLGYRKTAGGGTANLIETSGSANRRTILQGKWVGTETRSTDKRYGPTAQKHYMGYGAETHRRRNDLTAQWQTAGLQADRVGGAEPPMGDGHQAARTQREVHRTSRGETDWTNWRRGCL